MPSLLASLSGWVRSPLTGNPPVPRRRFKPTVEPLEDRWLPSHSGGIPDLHSRPSAPVAIYMDFDGDSCEGRTDIDAYDEDGVPSTFNATERTNITTAWRQLSTYFAMFDVDVTTVPTTKPKAWVVIGNNVEGGSGLVGSFPNDSCRGAKNPSSHARNRVSAIAHEVGHVFGLWHQSDYDLDGNKTHTYTSGYDSLHGALMGADYAQYVNKWFLGHPGSSPSYLQDDLAVIASKISPYQPPGGDGYRADDFGGTIATARPLTVGGTKQTGTGIIERLGDRDAFSFTSTGGTYSISAQPDAPSGVDLKLEIYSSGGALLAAHDDPATNAQQITMFLASGTYYAILSSHGNYADLGQYVVTIQPSSLPAGWNSQDLGAVGIAGAVSFNAASGTYNFLGSGSDIGDQRDHFRFAYLQLTGDGSITARVTYQQNTDPLAKAGLMIRETMGVDSKNALAARTPGNGVVIQRRASTGGSTTDTFDTEPSAPYWLRLVRSGDSFVGHWSSDGATWNRIGGLPVAGEGSESIAMAPTVYIGLAVTSHNNEVLNLSMFDNVSTTGKVSVPPPPGTIFALPAPTGLTVARGSGASLLLNWNVLSGANYYVVQRSMDGVTFTDIATTTTNNYTDAGLSGSHRYFYRVNGWGTFGRGAPSAIVNLINRPSAVTNLTVTSWTSTQLILNWRDTSGETGYRILRSSDGVTFTTRALVSESNIPSWTDTGLISDRTYWYQVIPTSVFGDGPSAAASGTTKATGFPPPPPIPPPSEFAAARASLVTDPAEIPVHRHRFDEVFSQMGYLLASGSIWLDMNLWSRSSRSERRITGRLLSALLVKQVLEAGDGSCRGQSVIAGPSDSLEPQPPEVAPQLDLACLPLSGCARRTSQREGLACHQATVPR